MTVAEALKAIKSVDEHKICVSEGSIFYATAYYDEKGEMSELKPTYGYKRFLSEINNMEVKKIVVGIYSIFLEV